MLERIKAAASRLGLTPEPSRPVSRQNYRICNPWHCVSIAGGPDCCLLAKSARNNRFLSFEAPRLPLAECPTAHTCTCQFRHHADRRQAPRRAEDQGMPSRRHVDIERRAGMQGRRAED